MSNGTEQRKLAANMSTDTLSYDGEGESGKTFQSVAADVRRI